VPWPKVCQQLHLHLHLTATCPISSHLSMTCQSMCAMAQAMLAATPVLAIALQSNMSMSSHLRKTCQSMCAMALVVPAVTHALAPHSNMSHQQPHKPDMSEHVCNGPSCASSCTCICISQQQVHGAATQLRHVRACVQWPKLC
jgi:hypothetical protein